MVKILDGNAAALKMREELAAQIKREFTDKNKRPPHLAIVLVGSNKPSQVFVAGKIKACKDAGITVTLKELDYTITQKELNTAIKELNKDTLIDGIVLQLPLPVGLNANEAINLIDVNKDADGITHINLGRLISADERAIIPGTAAGVVNLLESNGISLRGKDVTLVNRSLIVGKPLAVLLTSKDATVTVCHTKTLNLDAHLKRADVVISAVGIKNFILTKHVKKGAIVVDVGITKEDNKIYGDVDFENVKELASFITPVPGGVGPMTIAYLLKNTDICAQRRKSNT